MLTKECSYCNLVSKLYEGVYNFVIFDLFTIAIAGRLAFIDACTISDPTSTLQLSKSQLTVHNGFDFP